jgi:transcriptional regulator with XRE-family HTH domain
MRHSGGVLVFAKRLREARQRRGLSQRQLGLQAGLDASSASPRINQYEAGKHVPNLQMAERLAKVLGVPAPYFFASDDALANWILAYDSVDPGKRKAIVAAAE